MLNTRLVLAPVRLGISAVVTTGDKTPAKKKHAEKFLEEGAKLKAYVFFKGRSIVFKDKGEILLLRLAQDLEDLGKVESLPRLEGKRMIMMIAPKK